MPTKVKKQGGYLDKIKKLSVYERLLYWIRERRQIRAMRLIDDNPPWTNDPILQKYRFCNVQREHDRVTVWIRKHWREPYRADIHLWFAMLVARLFNNPETLAEIGYPVPWTVGVTVRVYRITAERKEQKKTTFNSAYIVSTNGIAKDKVKYLVEEVLNPMWRDRKILTPCHLEDPILLSDYSKILQRYNGIAGFMAGQIIADLKYVEPLNHADDWETFAVSGPGSRRGMNRLLERSMPKGTKRGGVRPKWNETEWHKELLKLQVKVNRNLGAQLHAQDLQNCLCEFDKYERVLWGEGRPKQLYKGT